MHTILSAMLQIDNLTKNISKEIVHLHKNEKKKINFWCKEKLLANTIFPIQISIYDASITWN